MQTSPVDQIGQGNMCSAMNLEAQYMHMEGQMFQLVEMSEFLQMMPADEALIFENNGGISRVEVTDKEKILETYLRMTTMLSSHFAIGLL